MTYCSGRKCGAGSLSTVRVGWPERLAWIPGLNKADSGRLGPKMAAREAGSGEGKCPCRTRRIGMVCTSKSVEPPCLMLTCRLHAAATSQDARMGYLVEKVALLQGVCAEKGMQVAAQASVCITGRGGACPDKQAKQTTIVVGHMQLARAAMRCECCLPRLEADRPAAIGALSFPSLAPLCLLISSFPLHVHMTGHVLESRARPHRSTTNNSLVRTRQPLCSELTLAPKLRLRCLHRGVSFLSTFRHDLCPQWVPLGHRTP